jgi:hypothetical protein
MKTYIFTKKFYRRNTTGYYEMMDSRIMGVYNDYDKAMAEAERLEIEKAQIEKNLMFEIARITVYQELFDELDTEGKTLGDTEPIIDMNLTSTNGTY